MIRTSCGFPNWWFIHSSSPPPPIFLLFFHSVVKRGGQEGFSVRKLSQLDTEPILVVVCLDCGGYCGHDCACSPLCSVVYTRYATWIPCTFFNFSIFLSIFFLPSANNKDRTQWWIWFSGECKSAHAFKALLQPAQVDSHLACSWSWCLFNWWLFSMPTLPCHPATNTPQLQPHTARPVPSGIQ